MSYIVLYMAILCGIYQIKNIINKKIINKNYCRQKPNTTGYYRVDKQPGKRYKYGFTYRYSWKENGKIKTLKSTDIQKLEKKVKDRGLKWQKVPIQTELLP